MNEKEFNTRFPYKMKKKAVAKEEISLKFLVSFVIASFLTIFTFSFWARTITPNANFWLVADIPFAGVYYSGLTLIVFIVTLIIIHLFIVYFLELIKIVAKKRK